MCKKNKVIYIFLIYLVSPLYAYGFEPLNTDDTGTIKQSSNQIEQYFYSINKLKQVLGPSQASVSPGEEFIGPGSSKGFPIMYTHGISKTVEVAIGTHYYATPRGNYSPISSNTISMKWRYFGEDSRNWSLAVKPLLQLPNSQSQQIIGLGQAAINFGSNLIASYYSEKDVDFHFNAQYVRSPYNTNYLSAGSAIPLRTNLYTLSAASVLAVTKQLKVALDIGIQTNPQSTSQSTVMYSMLATIISLTNEVDIGISILRSALNPNIILTGSGPNSTRLDFGITWRFN